MLPFFYVAHGFNPAKNDFSRELILVDTNYKQNYMVILILPLP